MQNFIHFIRFIELLSGNFISIKLSSKILAIFFITDFFIKYWNGISKKGKNPIAEYKTFWVRSSLCAFFANSSRILLISLIFISKYLSFESSISGEFSFPSPWSFIFKSGCRLIGCISFNSIVLFIFSLYFFLFYHKLFYFLFL